MHGGGEQLEYVKVQDLVGTYFKKADEVCFQNNIFFIYNCFIFRFIEK
jgi:hypothetical protein